MSRVFLSAKWEYLVMLNYEVDPEVLERHLPPYTEIDYFNGRALVSLVGFLFNDTRVMGIRWPGLTNFEEVNLRYYVKHFSGREWNRGVGFISEIVPKYMVSGLANMLYNEHYSRAAMKHRIITDEDRLHVEYEWKKKGQGWNSISVKAGTALQPITSGSEEEFIFEHYYGYNRLNTTTAIEYKVEHPLWEVYPVAEYALSGDIEKLYGKEFVPFISGKEPCSVFLARGSEVKVRTPLRIRGHRGNKGQDSTK